jgi:hypothetical protein
MEWEEAEKLVEKVYPKYKKQIETLFREGLKQLKHFTCCICGYGEFDITKEWKCPKCGEEYEGYYDAFNCNIAEELCQINTKILEEALGKEEAENWMENACKLARCPLEGDCPLGAR